jgi:hypothetical protein
MTARPVVGLISSELLCASPTRSSENGALSSQDEIAIELERLTAEHWRRAGDICELLEHAARGSADWLEPPPVRHSDRAAQAPTLELVGR